MTAKLRNRLMTHHFSHASIDLVPAHYLLTLRAAYWLPVSARLQKGTAPLERCLDSDHLVDDHWVTPSLPMARHRRLRFQSQRLEEGSPIDQAVFGALIFGGLCVLARRPDASWRDCAGITLSSSCSFCTKASAFSGQTFQASRCRRWLKAVGDPVMVLVLLSDPFPARAITAAISRCAYVLIPLSVLFCKYYENLGRAL